MLKIKVSRFPLKKYGEYELSRNRSQSSGSMALIYLRSNASLTGKFDWMGLLLPIPAKPRQT